MEEVVDLLLQILEEIQTLNENVKNLTEIVQSNAEYA